jgi:RecJ-like exonuclease
MDWITHEEDVWFEFRGSRPEQLKSGRFYRGTVDGYADFGVFVDLATGVTGLLHRSELDRRLESLDWEPGDTVFVQVKNVRDNGNIDLGWSIRQSEKEFRGARVHDPEGDRDGEKIESGTGSSDTVRHRPTSDSSSQSSDESTDRSSSRDDDDAESESDFEGSDFEESEVKETTLGASETQAEAEVESRSESASDAASESRSASASDAGTDESGGLAAEPEATSDRERVTVDALDDHVGEQVRIEGEVVGARQTGGPTVFEVRDETGVVDCAAFVEAGVRAYPGVEVGDRIRLDGEVEVRRDELQVETEALSVLEGEEAAAVDDRLDAALAEKARPEAVEPLAADEAVEAVSERLGDAAEEIRRAVLQSRPIVVRHAATADGYVAGAAIERAVLPLIREEHAQADAEYHYFTRRPLDGVVYGMDAATNDVTRMLQDQDRHGEKLPLVVLVGTGSTVESCDGLGLLGVYGARRVVVDAAAADEDVADTTEVLVNPQLEGVGADGLSTGALTANLAAAVNDEVRDDLMHLPAVSYWEATPAAYEDLAAEAGYDAERVSELREAIALEAYYQSYEDKRELITDLLFEDGGSPASKREGGETAAGNLAKHVSTQFRTKMDAEVETATANLETLEAGGVRFAVLDADAYTHRYDFPPTTLLADELFRRERAEGPFVLVTLTMDDLYLRCTADVDVRAVAERAAELAPEAGIAAAGIREGRIEFLAGARDDVREAVVDALTEQF